MQILTSSVQFREGKFVNTRCFTTDVTELKRTQDALRANEEKLRQLLEALQARPHHRLKRSGDLLQSPAAQLAGRTPEVGVDEWCVTWKIYTPDGTYLPTISARWLSLCVKIDLFAELRRWLKERTAPVFHSCRSPLR